MTTVAIIGTAGRREDGARLKWDVYCKMRLAVIKELLKIPRPWKGRSGGATGATKPILGGSLMILGLIVGAFGVGQLVYAVRKTGL